MPLNLFRPFAQRLGHRTNSTQARGALNFIDGVERAALDGQTVDNVNPANLTVISKIPRSGQADVNEAVAAAAGAGAAWAATPLAARAAILERAANIIEADLTAFALAESLDSGKPLKLATHVDIPRAVANLRFFAAAAAHHPTACHWTEGPNLGAVNLTARAPVGVVGLVTPWNLPLYLLTWKVREDATRRNLPYSPEGRATQLALGACKRAMPI